jgi:transposase InsO family protein
MAAIMDGFSRRLLCLRVYRHTPRACDMAALARHVARQFGKPRFIITDHGTQFRRQFRVAMDKTGIIPVQARVRAPYLNGKIERTFRTFRVWWRLALTGLTDKGIQRRLDDFGAWFNEHRPHGALQGRTPQEAWEGRYLPTPVPIRARDQLQPQIEIRRRHYHGDPRLPIIDISVRLAA